MASLLHETLVELLAEHPELLVPALQEQLGDLPVDLEFHRSESTQSQVPPLRLDLGLEVRRRGETNPVAAISLEVQLSKDPNKPYSWLLYHAGQHYRLRVPSYLVVIASNPEVAAWAAGPFSSGMVTMRPLVITPAHFPPITDPEEAKRSLERTFLSGLVHATEPVAADIGRALLAALDASPDDVGLRYWDTLLAVLGDAIRSTLEMEMKDWKPKSDWGKRWLAKIQDEGLAEGLAKGIAKGLDEGLTKGRVEDRASSIVELLDVRGIPLDPPLRQRIAACTDYQVLTQWLHRAATATAAEEVFVTGP